MCGIVGYVGEAAATTRLVEGLRRLEYRGYDSAGVAVADAHGTIERRRAEGKLRNLEEKLSESPLSGSSGIAHTRWATHGASNERNAHPHNAGRVYVVHNGIIENYRPLKDSLIEQGIEFASDTDTEVIAHLIDQKLSAGTSPQLAFEDTLKQLEGAFALAVLVQGVEDMLFGARSGGPLVAGVGDGESFLASDPIAIAPYTNRVIYLEEGDYVIATKTEVQIRNREGSLANRPVVTSDVAAAMVDKGSYRHFMEKEIHEQPEVLGRTLANYLDPTSGDIRPVEGIDFSTIRRLILVGCGTAFYAGQISKYWFESLAHLPTETDIASEFRYRQPALLPGDCALFISQSGETADTLAALRFCKESGIPTIALVNSSHSSMAREADIAVKTLAGPEIGVASTKAFTCQLAALASLAVAAGGARGKMSAERQRELASELLEVPRLVSEVLGQQRHIQSIAQDISHAETVLYLGRGCFYPLAMEGALKLKEISYIHAEGYAAGELKHGPIALVDEGIPVVVIAPYDRLFKKTVSSIEEVNARGGVVTAITDAEGKKELEPLCAAIVELPHCPDLAQPIVAAVAVQLLAYLTAVHKGTDVDQPRNLAKSVTVE